MTIAFGQSRTVPIPPGGVVYAISAAATPIVSWVFSPIGF